MYWGHRCLLTESNNYLQLVLSDPYCVLGARIQGGIVISAELPSVQTRHMLRSPEEQRPDHNLSPGTSETTRLFQRVLFNFSIHTLLPLWKNTTLFFIRILFLFISNWVQVLREWGLLFRKYASPVPALDGIYFRAPRMLDLAVWFCWLIGRERARFQPILEVCLHAGPRSLALPTLPWGVCACASKDEKCLEQTFMCPTMASPAQSS